MMNLKINRYFLIALFLLCSFSFFAQNAVESLTLKKAIDLGVENSKLLKVSKEKINVALAKLGETNTQQLPSVKLSSNYSRLSDNITPFAVSFPGAPNPVILNPQILNQYSENATLSQLLYSGGRVHKTIKSLEFLESASKLDYENDKAGIISNIINAYYSLYKLEQSQKILKENEELIKARLADLENLEQNGIVLRNDVLKLELSLSQINIQQIDIANSYEVTKYALNILIGLPEMSNYELDTNGLFSYQLDKSLPEYESQALSNKPDLNAFDKRLQASKLLINVAKASCLPTLSVSGNYNYLRPNQRVFPNQDRFDGTWSVGASLVWDISSIYNNKPFVHEAKSNYEQNKQQKTVIEDNLKTEVYTNYLAFSRNVEHLKLSQKTLVEAEENYRLINERLQNKIVIATDLQDALNYLNQSQLNVLVDKAEIDLAYFRFMKSIGNLNQL